MKTFKSFFICIILIAGCTKTDQKQQARVYYDSLPATQENPAEVYAEPDSADNNSQTASDVFDEPWAQIVQMDSVGKLDSTTFKERYRSITADTVNSQPMTLPVGGRVSGPSVVRVQVLLDRVRFSPGSMDGNYGNNTRKAVYWFQKQNGLRTTGVVDDLTFKKLLEKAGNFGKPVITYTLAASDINYPFTKNPKDIYERAKLKGSYYENLAEKLGEQFHISPVLLKKLNPAITFESAKAGDAVNVPNVINDTSAATTSIAKLVVSHKGFYLHAMDAAGNIVYHLPSVLGSAYDPSPEGNLTVRSISENPYWHYQPKILAKVKDTEKDAVIPAGPNNSVGLVWMALSKRHYGIHGTNAPETIGYAQSAGCVRLTNWDALFLSKKIQPGVPVEFVDAGKSTDETAVDSLTAGEPEKKQKN